MSARPRSRSRQPYRYTRRSDDTANITHPDRLSAVPAECDVAPVWTTTLTHGLAKVAHHTHALAQYRSVLLCTRCGTWTKQTIGKTKLWKPCPRDFPSYYALVGITRLAVGHYPYGPGPNTQAFDIPDGRNVPGSQRLAAHHQ
eukprot:9365402-Pyramimonas_sp.AAC.1